MSKIKFIETIGEESVLKTEWSQPWQFKQFSNIPFEVVNEPQGHLLTVGSASISLPTNSYGLTHHAAIDVVRLDNSGTWPVDVDHYIATKSGGSKIYSVYITPPTEYHHLKLSDNLVSNLSWSWRKVIRDILSAKKV